MRYETAGLAALVVLGACSKRIPPAEIGPVPTAEAGTATQELSELDIVELPAIQAYLVARAGSDTICFETDESLLDDDSQATRGAEAAWLLANPNIRASIEGHGDERGTREYNFALGERRANVARDFLSAKGVSAPRLVVTSWGKERPVALGSNDEAWAQNHRSVTLVVR